MSDLVDYETRHALSLIMSQNSQNLDDRRIYETVGCTLQAYGANFEPDAFLTESNFPQEKILLKSILGLPDELKEKVEQGELPYKNGFDLFDTPYLLIRVSELAELSLQIEEAILFLRRYLDDLNKLRHYPNVENVLLQFLVEKNASSPEAHNFSAEFYDLYSKSGIQGLLVGTVNSKP